MDIAIGDILEMKKEHPCGSRRWQVLRVGMICGCAVRAAAGRSCSRGGRPRRP